MRNANKSPKIRIGERSGEVIWNLYPKPDYQSPPKVNNFLQLVGPIITPNFNEIS